MSLRMRRRCLALLCVAGVSATPTTVAAATTPTSAASTAQRPWGDAVFQRLSTFPVFENSTDPTDVTVAEITAASSDGKTLISTDSPGNRVAFTDISDPSHPVPDVGRGGPVVPSALALGGEPTSVAVYGE